MTDCSFPQKPLLRVLTGETLGPPPIWLMRQAGRYLPEYRKIREEAGSFLKLCYTPALAAEVTLQPVRRFGVDAAILFSDILVIAEAIGVPLAFRENEGPVLDPVRDGKGVAALSAERCLTVLAPIFETVRRVKSDLPGQTALIGFAGAPWTVASYIVEGRTSRDFHEVKRLAFSDKVAFKALIDLLVEASAAYLIAQIDAGAEVLQIFDSWAGVLSKDDFDDWVIEPTKRLIAAVKTSHPEVPIIGFPRGGGVHLARYAERTGVDGLGLDTTVPLDWARDALPPKLARQGNLDPVRLLTGGVGMEAEIEAILQLMSEVPFIFNLGHGVLPGTPPDHVASLVNKVKCYIDK